MNCRIAELRNKEVINVKNGERIGFISDVEIDTHTARISSIIVYGKLRCFGVFGREKDFIIPWCDISLFGNDAVLVKYETPKDEEKTGLSAFLEKLFH